MTSEGHRVGYPDLLVRGADRVDDSATYHPVEVKWHKIIERAQPPHDAAEPRTLRYSTLDQPTPSAAHCVSGYGLRIGSRTADFLQLAHYYRMLEACGFGPGQALVGVIGTDDLFEKPVLAWADLQELQVRAFSRSSPDGWRLRSLLERYDHEHAFRIKIAAVAQLQTGRPDHDPELLVRPIVNKECSRCQWWEHCLPQLDPDDVSLRIDKAPLDMREIATLRRHGITTITDLVDAELDQLLEWYLPEVSHRGGAEGRIRVATRRAGMLLEGISFDRETVGPIEIPQADVEIDLDIESSADGRVYLWGFLVQHCGDSAPIYHEFSRFDDLDDRAEAALAADAFTWLRSVVDTAPSVAVFHYSGYEIAKIGELARREQDELLDWAAGIRGRALRRSAGDRQGALFRRQWPRAQVDGRACRVQLARRRSWWPQFTALVCRGSAWRDERGTCPGAAPCAGIQRGRRDRHQSSQSVAASAVISRSRVRRWARSITASTSSIRIAGSART